MMLRSMLLVAAWVAAAHLSAPDARLSASAPPQRQGPVGRDLDIITQRLTAGRQTPEQAIAEARLLAAGYQSLPPLLRSFSPADFASNRLAARRSLEWLARAGALYGSDPVVAQALLRTYDSIGGFYADYGRFYSPGAFVAYASAARLAQRLMLEGYGTYGFDRDAERFALAYGTMAALNGTLLIGWNTPRDLPDGDSLKPAPAPAIHPVELPEINVAQLNADQKEAWAEVRTRFRTVARAVYQARVLLNQLSERLRRERTTVNAQTATDAMKMQGFLEEAADLARDGRFDIAVEALRQADYVRTKLKGVTGQ